MAGSAEAAARSASQDSEQSSGIPAVWAGRVGGRGPCTQRVRWLERAHANP
jgi:hypothetical protein